MKNFEAYKDYISKYGTNTMAIKNGEATNCVGIQCSECLFKPANECKKRRGQWLYEEYKKPKVKISKATKVILESFDKRWKWITRDADKVVYLYEDEPYKVPTIWERESGDLENITNIFGINSFDFLSWENEEPTNIKELLENCEVVDDEQI